MPLVLRLKEIFQARVARGEGYGYYVKVADNMLSQISDTQPQDGKREMILAIVQECLKSPPDRLFAGETDY